MRPSVGLLVAGAIAAVAVMAGLVACHPAPPPGIALASAAIVLPDDTEALPPGPHVDLVAARCTACHSVSMVTNQPPLAAAQWQATVTKMREAYHADVPDADIPAILAYLDALSAAKAPPHG